MGIQAAFLAWLPWEAKAPFLIGPCAWAGRCLGSKVLLQQQVTLLGSHRGLVVAGGPPAFQGTWTSCCGIVVGAGWLWQQTGGMGWHVWLGRRTLSSGCRWKLHLGQKANK